MSSTIIAIPAKNNPWEVLSPTQARVVRHLLNTGRHDLLKGMTEFPYGTGDLIREFACDLTVLINLGIVEGKSCDELAENLF